MKTFLVVTLYTVMVAALDLGGAVWAGLHAAHPAKQPTAAVVKSVATPVKTGSANGSIATIPTDT